MVKKKKSYSYWRPKHISWHYNVEAYTSLLDIDILAAAVFRVEGDFFGLCKEEEKKND